ncbi:MAG TPA: tetratricopeptide repeat protein [Gammaproteobacteria bacterium]|nr:tetratricopeptide repeat protein [Gammaproteobacteria bacterium]
MDEYLSDIERLEMAKKWWKDNYKSILLGALIAVVVVGGWRYWQYRVQSRSAAASGMFASLLQSMKAHDDAAALKTGNAIMDQYPDTAYAAQAALALAQVQVTAGKLPEGEKMLQWAMDHAKDDGLKTLAQLRLARVQLAAGDAKTALATLGNDDPQGFAPLFDAVRGDADVKLGDTAAARAAYQKALDGWTDQLGDKSLLKMKLDSLPGTAAPAPAATSKGKS